MKMVIAILSSNKGRIVVAVVVAYVLWQAWLSFAAPGKIAGPFPGTSERVHVLVTLPFPPERFHIQTFQKHGRVSGTNDNTVEVRGVKRSDLSALARPYWVRRVEPLPQGG
jgi:hypothetical protein